MEKFKRDMGMFGALGRDAFLENVERLTKERDNARRGLAATPPPEATLPLRSNPTQEQIAATMDQDWIRRCVREVRVVPAGIKQRGERIPVEERAYVFWTGSEEPYEPPEYAFDPEMGQVTKAAKS